MKIGLECHVQLPTRSKMFCSCPTADCEFPNTYVCPTCLGMPGSRPVLNKQVLIYGIMIAKMLNCEVNDTTWFARKTYFYPDMSKSVQITQYDNPIGERGVYYLDGKKPIRITRIHIEEDPGSTKRTADLTSLVDYNRSGIPLAEIVTEPDIATPAEAREFLTQVVRDLRHLLDIPDDLEWEVKCDCNISVGTERVEIKNVSGLKNAEKALHSEMVRQIAMIKAKKKIVRETRRYDPNRDVTISMRVKEFEDQYGYIDEPDLGIYHIKDLADSIRISESPQNMILRITSQYKLDPKMAKQLVNTSMDLAILFEDIAKEFGTPNAIKWVGGPISANWRAMESRGVTDLGKLKELIGEFSEGKITDTQCTIGIKSYMTGQDATAAQEDSAGLETLINKFLDENPKIVTDYQKNDKAANQVIGFVMRQTGGKYSSAEVVETAKKLIEARF